MKNNNNTSQQTNDNFKQPTEGNLKKLETKSVRMVDQADDQKSLKSRGSKAPVDPYEDKTIE